MIKNYVRHVNLLFVTRFTRDLHTKLLLRYLNMNNITFLSMFVSVFRFFIFSSNLQYLLYRKRTKTPVGTERSSKGNSKHTSTIVNWIIRLSSNCMLQK